MGKAITNFTIAFIVGLVAMFFFLKQCQPGWVGQKGNTQLQYDSNFYQLPVTQQDHQPNKTYIPQKFLTDSSNKIDKKPRPKSITIDSQFTKIDTGQILSQVDTQAILNQANEIHDLLDYYKYRTYANTIVDSPLKFKYRIGINQNKLDTFQSEYAITRPTDITKPEPVQHQLWLTGSADYEDMEIGATYQWENWGAGIQYKAYTRRDLAPVERVQLELNYKLYEN